MSKKQNYDYLRKFLNPPENTKGESRNWFFPLKKKDIEEAEARLGYTFPPQLRDFYLEIGYGSLKVPVNASENYKFYGINRINPPDFIADIMLLGHDSGYISQETLDLMEPGDMPFLEIGDSSSFLFMKPQSEHPNGVYYFDQLIESEFKNFIWKLYHVSPSYYEELF